MVIAPLGWDKDGTPVVRTSEGQEVRPKTAWARLAAMTDEEVEANALSDPDNPTLTDEQLARMRLTQERFAARLGIPLGTLRDWEQERSQPDTNSTRAAVRDRPRAGGRRRGGCGRRGQWSRCPRASGPRRCLLIRRTTTFGTSPLPSQRRLCGRLGAVVVVADLLEPVGGAARLRVGRLDSEMHHRRGRRRAVPVPLARLEDDRVAWQQLLD